MNRWKESHPDETLGFRPSCQCSAPPVPCTVLDPFGGSGTTQAVARELGRRSVYIDASQEYADMAIRRVESTPVALPNTPTIPATRPPRQLSLEAPDA